jgi:hypothetical protein
MLGPENGEDRQLEVVRPPPEQLLDTVELPVGETERSMERLLRDRGQKFSLPVAYDGLAGSLGAAAAGDAGAGIASTRETHLPPQCAEPSPPTRLAPVSACANSVPGTPHPKASLRLTCFPLRPLHLWHEPSLDPDAPRACRDLGCVLHVCQRYTRHPLTVGYSSGRPARRSRKDWRNGRRSER